MLYKFRRYALRCGCCRKVKGRRFPSLPVKYSMARRRSSTTICDSFLCTVAVAAPLVLSLAYYRNDLRQLLRILFLGVVLFGALLTIRHSLRRALLRLNGWLSRGKKEEEEGERVGVYAVHCAQCSAHCILCAYIQYYEGPIYMY